MTARDIVQLIEQGRLQQAETLLRHQLQRDPLPLASYLLGRVLLAQFRFDEAEPVLRDAVDARPERSSWRHDLARALLGGGRCLEAMRELDACIASDPAPIFRYDKAMCALNVGDDATAELELEAALAEGWESSQAWFQLGRIRSDRGDDSAAREAFERALLISPEHVDASFGLGAIEFRAGRDETAIRLFERVLELSAGHIGASYNLGRALVRAGRVKEGRTVLERFRKLSAIEELIENHRMYLVHYPASTEARIDLGALLLEAGRPREASRILEEALALGVRAPEVTRLLADAYRLEGREADAARVERWIEGSRP